MIAGLLLAASLTGLTAVNAPQPESPAAQNDGRTPFAVTVKFEVNERGEAERCEVLTWRGMAGSPDPCQDIVNAPGQAEPFRDASGKPVRKTLVLRQELEVRDQ
jgi:hypothetical protein